MHCLSCFCCSIQNDREVNSLVYVDMIQLLFPPSSIMLALSCDCIRSKPKLDKTEIYHRSNPEADVRQSVMSEPDE